MDEKEYKVKIVKAHSYGWFTIYIYWGDTLIKEKSACNSYTLASRWAKRKIKNHKKARKILGELYE